jgi:aminoglycoside phosphotransferase (APT) family kinase protein
MEPSEVRRAVDAAGETAAALGLEVGDAVVVHNSDRIAVRLTPCDVLARVAAQSLYDGQGQAAMEYEAEVARRLAGTDSPVGELDPRVEPGVHLRDGFVITLWTYYEPVGAGTAASPLEQLGMSSDLAPADYAHALARLHVGLGQVDLAAPHISARIAGWVESVHDPESTPELPDRDRELLGDTFRRVTTAINGWGAPEQLLHGEPHPGNVLSTSKGPLFIDLGTCQRGPVEYDLAYVPDEVVERYPGADQDLVQQFRILMWAGVTTMRWTRDDQLPNRDYWRIEALNQLRAALDC